jgi:two-component system, CAI-1 autoinducer sensor kinase/phosphatase CqsS
MNGNSAMWMATVATMIVVYFHLTDWRIASLGLILGAVMATAVAEAVAPSLPSLPYEHLIVFAFALCSGLLLALSSANLRRERLRHSLTVIGIMAHELRTPLATMGLIAQAIRTEATAVDTQHAQRLGELASRMDALTRAINHHIDLQMANAQYTHRHTADQLLSVHQLIEDVLEHYPFGSKRERQCVQVIMHADFWFRGSTRQFTQVLHNLLKNALHSLKTAQSRYDKGDLRIELGMREGVGRIQITDRGVGIDPSKLKLIFEPFYSTANETGHGLGLAFCKQVVEAAHGTLTVHSEPALGATFTIQIPCQPAPSPETTTSHEVPLVSPT